MNLLVFISIIFITLTLDPVFAAERMNLSVFLDKVAAQNLDIKIEGAKSDVADAKGTGINIPPPMAGVIQMNEKSGNSAQGFEISQEIPFPTKLSGDYSSRKYEAKAQDQMRMARESEILAQAKLLYFDLWSKQERQSLLKMKTEILQRHIRLSRSSARSDSSASIHLLKAESDSDLLENEMEENSQQIRGTQAKLAVLLNIDPTNFEIVTEEPPLSLAPEIGSLKTSHQLKSAELTLESLKSKEFEAKSSWLPDFNLRYKKMGATSMSDDYNEVMVGVTLPFVFFWEPHSESRKAVAERSQAEYELIKKKREIESETVSFSRRAESLRKQLSTLNEKLIPRAEKRVKIIRNLAPRDMETLQDHRETMEALPEIKLKALELRLQYEETIANLEKYISNKGKSHE